MIEKISRIDKEECFIRQLLPFPSPLLCRYSILREEGSILIANVAEESNVVISTAGRYYRCCHKDKCVSRLVMDDDKFHFLKGRDQRRR